MFLVKGGSYRPRCLVFPFPSTVDDFLLLPSKSKIEKEKSMRKMPFSSYSFFSCSSNDENEINESEENDQKVKNE